MMLVNFLVVSVIILGVIIYYIFYIAPKMDPLKKAESFASQNMTGEAILEYKKAIERNPDDFTIHYKIAIIYLGIDEIDQAVIHLERILELNKFNYEVDKVDIQKKLASAYTLREEYDKSFRIYIDILKSSPADIDSLYHVAFMSLGQEEFDIAQKYFSKLIKLKNSDFDILFGAGICNYQTGNFSESINYFKQASALNPNSDINNLALAFAMQKKSDFKQSLQFISRIIDRETDPETFFIAKRFQAFTMIQARKFEDAIRAFEDMLTQAKANENTEAIMLTLYDLGFASVKADRSNRAYDYWNELYSMDKKYKNVQALVTQLRKEMEIDYKLIKESFDISVIDYIDDWIEKAFPKNFLWDICGLKSDLEINIKDIAVTTRISTGKDDVTARHIPSDSYDNIESFIKLDNENFRIISNRLVAKLGYKVDQILQTYRDSDGVDFLAVSPEKEKILVWVRRWDKTKVGEIPLRNFAQAINDMKTKRGLFITTAELTTGAEKSIENLSKVVVVRPEEVGDILRGLV